MRFFLHFHEFLTILSLSNFFSKISVDISVKSKYRYMYDYWYFYPWSLLPSSVPTQGGNSRWKGGLIFIPYPLLSKMDKYFVCALFCKDIYIFKVVLLHGGYRHTYANRFLPLAKANPHDDLLVCWFLTIYRLLAYVNATEKYIIQDIVHLLSSSSSSSSFCFQKLEC